MRLRQGWPKTEGALGLWFAAQRLGRRQISVSVWRSPEDLRAFVRSPEQLRIMRENRNTGELFTIAWTSERLDRAVIWHEAIDRLIGRIDGVPHH
jgi:heme-degrading monooxygenase HmoA